MLLRVCINCHMIFGCISRGKIHRCVLCKSPCEYKLMKANVDSNIPTTGGVCRFCYSDRQKERSKNSSFLS